MHQNQLLSPDQVASQLGITIHTLAVWRCTGRYPLKFHKIGNRVRYRQSDIDEFVNSGLQVPS